MFLRLGLNSFMSLGSCNCSAARHGRTPAHVPASHSNVRSYPSDTNVYTSDLAPLRAGASAHPGEPARALLISRMCHGTQDEGYSK